MLQSIEAIAYAHEALGTHLQDIEAILTRRFTEELVETTIKPAQLVAHYHKCRQQARIGIELAKLPQPIYTDADGRPIERPDPPAASASPADKLTYIRAMRQYLDRKADLANAAFAKNFKP